MSRTAFRAGRDQASLSENMELLTGQRGDGSSRAVTYKDLAKLGVLTLRRGAGGKVVPEIVKPGDSEKPGVDRPIQPQNVKAMGGFSAILVSWSNPSFRGYAHAEVWRSQNNQLTDAVLLATTPAAVFSDVVNPGSVYYYWVRFKNSNDIFGPFSEVAKGETALDVSKVIEELSEQIKDSETFAALLRSAEDFKENVDQAIEDISKINDKMKEELQSSQKIIEENKRAIKEADQKYQGITDELSGEIKTLVEVKANPYGIDSFGFYKTQDNLVAYRVVADIIEFNTKSATFRPFVLKKNKMMLDAAFIKGLKVEDLEVSGDSSFSGVLRSATGIFTGSVQISDVFYAGADYTLINSSKFYVLDGQKNTFPLLATASDLFKPIPNTVYGLTPSVSLTFTEIDDTKFGEFALRFVSSLCVVKNLGVIIDGRSVPIYSARKVDKTIEVKNGKISFDVDSRTKNDYVYIRIVTDDLDTPERRSIICHFSCEQKSPNHVGFVELSRRQGNTFHTIKSGDLNNPNKVIMPRVQVRELDVAGTAYIKDGWALFNPHTFAVANAFGEGKLPFIVDGKGRVFIDTAFISKATITELTGQKLVYDEITATLKLTAPRVEGGQITGSIAGFGNGGPYGIGAISGEEGGYRTFIHSSGLLQTNHLQANGGYINNILAQNVTIAENCTIRGHLDGASGHFKGTVEADKIIGDIAKANIINLSTQFPNLHNLTETLHAGQRRVLFSCFIGGDETSQRWVKLDSDWIVTNNQVGAETDRHFRFRAYFNGQMVGENGFKAQYHCRDLFIRLPAGNGGLLQVCVESLAGSKSFTSYSRTVHVLVTLFRLAKDITAI
ncbi:hypothetical protein [Vibrio metschnikovii]|uniref:hypothetical protein n=1 Tax=Vibrio metschnikovii TaxID=28172 RepID=UPI001C2FA9AE|nr:hypothetical protein [Vibrio metschnikovii]